jgi:aspartate racemase
VLPKNQNEMTQIIENILAGKKGEEDKSKLVQNIQFMQKQGAEAIILGCTDLPLLLSQKDSPILLFDSLEILANATIEYATKP